MKRAITILLVFSFLIGYGQTIKNDRIYISNNENFELSPFAKIILHKKITKYNFVIKINKIWWSKYNLNKSEVEIIGVREYEINSGLVFTKNGDDLKNYYYPVNKNFKYKNFNDEINSNLKKDLKIKFYTTIYKTVTNPIIIINCIELLKEE